MKLSLPGWELRPLAWWVTAGKGRLQSQLASQRTIKKQTEPGKLSWLGLARGDFFFFFQYDNLERWAV